MLTFTEFKQNNEDVETQFDSYKCYPNAFYIAYKFRFYSSAN